MKMFYSNVVEELKHKHILDVEKAEVFFFLVFVFVGKEYVNRLRLKYK